MTEIAKSLIRRSTLKITRSFYSAYGKHVVEDRAVPDFRDGLKPVARRILWAMYVLGLHHTTVYKKSARVSGECFAAGTQISTPNGKQPIEFLVVGDLVNTSCGPHKISALIGNKNQLMYLATMKNGKCVVVSQKQKVKIVINGEFFWKPFSELSHEDDVVVEQDE